MSNIKIHTFLGLKFHKISTAIDTRDTTISYEGLLEKLLDYELFHKHDDAKKVSNTIITSVATPTK